MPDVFTTKCESCGSVLQSQSKATLEVHLNVCQGEWPPTVDSLSVSDRVQWTDMVYEIEEISEDLSGEEGRHVAFTPLDYEDTWLEPGESHIIHERLVNRWFRYETSTFHPLPDGMDALD